MNKRPDPIPPAEPFDVPIEVPEAPKRADFAGPKELRAHAESITVQALDLGAASPGLIAWRNAAREDAQAWEAELG